MKYEPMKSAAILSLAILIASAGCIGQKLVLPGAPGTTGNATPQTNQSIPPPTPLLQPEFREIAAENLTIDLYKGSSLMINNRIYIDPSEVPGTRLVTDYVLVPTVQACNKDNIATLLINDPKIFGPLDCVLGIKESRETNSIEPGETARVRDLNITATQAPRGIGFLLTLGGKVVYYAGTGISDAPVGRVDLALINAKDERPKIASFFVSSRPKTVVAYNANQTDKEELTKLAEQYTVTLIA